jgi:ATP phosphoribosyltransferase regulatory subunit HisZ
MENINWNPVFPPEHWAEALIADWGLNDIRFPKLQPETILKPELIEDQEQRFFID